MALRVGSVTGGMTARVPIAKPLPPSPEGAVSNVQRAQISRGQASATATHPGVAATAAKPPHSGKVDLRA